MPNTYTLAELPISLGAYEEIRGLLLKAGYTPIQADTMSNEVLVLDGVALTCVDLEDQEAQPSPGNERIMASLQSDCVDIYAGTFVCTKDDGSQDKFDFFFRTCHEPEVNTTEWYEAKSKRQDDLTEQYEDVAERLNQKYKSRVEFQASKEDIF